MSHQAQKAKRFVRGRRHLTVGIVTIFAVGIGLFAGSNLVAMAGGTSANPDTCGYNPAAAPKPGGGTVVFDENSVTRAIAFYGAGATGHIGAFTNDESGLLIGAGGSASTSMPAPGLVGNLANPPALSTAVNNTSIPLQAALTKAVGAGDSVVVAQAGHTSTTFVAAASGAAVGATSIPVVAKKAAFAYAAGSTVTDTTAGKYGEAAPPPTGLLGSGLDAVGRYSAPVIYLTDTTVNPLVNNQGVGDYEMGGTASNLNGSTPFANAIYGSWSPTVGTKPVNSNAWVLGPNADPIPASDALGGTTTSFNEGYGSEVVWNVNALGVTLIPGHVYRAQVITHDTDQNHTSGGGDTGEVCTTFGIPGISTVATGEQIHADGTANISDTATVGGVTTPLPTGSNTACSPVATANCVIMKAFGKTDATCSSTPIATKVVAINTTTPNGSYPSGNVQVNSSGTYKWTDELILGGASAAGGAGTCGSTTAPNNEVSVVSPRPTSLSSDAGGPYSPTTSLTDTATLAGGTSTATGTLAFSLYADNGSGGCGTLLGTSTITNIHGHETSGHGADGATYTGTVNAAAGTFFHAGTYHWTISYAGDGDNNGSSDPSGGGCPATDSAGPPPNHENPVILAPSIDITKNPKTQTNEAAGNGELTPAAGNTPGKAAWTLVVTNNGAVALTNVVVSDPNAPNCNITIGPLAVGASVTVQPTACFILGLTGTSYHNEADVSGQGGAQTVTDSDTADVTLINPHIQVTKTPPTQSVALGGIAHFTIVVKNDGDVSLSSVVVSDAQVPACARTSGQTGVLIASQDGGSFDPGDSFTYDCDSDPVSAPFTNAVGACAKDSLNGTVCDNDGSTGTPGSDCTTAGGNSADQCAGVGIDSIASSQDFKPKDTATISVTGPHGALNGKVDFSLYKGSCVSSHLIYQDLNVSVNASALASTASADFLSTLLASAGLSTNTAGTYNWALTYHGDTNGNADLTSACGTENFVVTNG